MSSSTAKQLQKINAKIEAMGKTKKKKRGTRTRSARERSMRGGGMDAGVAGHYGMLCNPCSGDLVPSAYRGKSGFISRFTGNFSLTSTALKTAALFSLNPAEGRFVAEEFNNASVASAGLNYNQPLPGFSFLSTNSSGARAIAVCMDLDYTGTELNRSGMFYGGVCGANAVSSGSTPSVNSLKNLFVNECRTPDRRVQLFWFPGVGNEEYQVLGNPGIDDTRDDSFNNLVFCCDGMPEGVQIRIRITTIFEWLPAISASQPSPSPVGGNSVVGGLEKLSSMAHNNVQFSASFAHGMSTRLGEYAQRAGGWLVDKAAQSAARYVNSYAGSRNVMQLM